MLTIVVNRHNTPRPLASQGNAPRAAYPARPFHHAAEASTSTRASIHGPRIAAGISPFLSAVPARLPATEVSYVKAPPPRRIPIRPAPDQAD